MRRVVTPELLDEDLGTPDEIRETLLDLRGFNRNLGGFSSMAGMLRAVAVRTGKCAVKLLDVAGGNGDVADHVACQLSNEGIQIRATVMDRAVSHMNGHDLKLNRVAGDALALPFTDGSFDVVSCNLFCHHLEAEEMIAFFNQALRVARLAVIASDLRRNSFHLFAANAGRLIYRSRLTRNDAPASVRRAYTMAEISEIAQRTTAASYAVSPHFFQRFGLILWKAKL
jgi:ubiquinone/menaquinone biosynthesis C-methylase UbiE